MGILRRTPPRNAAHSVWGCAGHAWCVGKVFASEPSVHAAYWLLQIKSRTALWVALLWCTGGSTSMLTVLFCPPVLLCAAAVLLQPQLMGRPRQLA